MKKKYVIRVGQDDGTSIVKCATLWVSESWFKKTISSDIGKTIKKMYRVAKRGGV